MLNLNEIFSDIIKLDETVKEKHWEYQEAIMAKDDAMFDIMQEMVKDADLIQFLKVDTAKMKKELKKRGGKKERKYPEF